MSSMVAQGVMVTPGADNRMTVVLCIDGNPVPMLMAADGSLSAPEQGHGRPAFPHKAPGTTPDTCQWAAHGQPVIAALPGGAAAPWAMDITPRRIIPTGALSRQIDVPIALARGPPASA